MSDPTPVLRTGRPPAPDGPQPTGAAPGPPGDGEPGDPSTEPVRIAATPASVAAGIDAAPASVAATPDTNGAPVLPAPPLPDWTDPPTGQVPRVLLEHAGEDPSPPALRGPTWREHASDWAGDDDLGLSFLLDDEDDETDATLIAGRGSAGEDPLDPTPPAKRARRRRSAARPDLPAAERAAETRSGAARHGRNPLVATATGVALGAVAVACFLLGPLTAVVLVAAVLAVAAGEALAALKRAGRRPLAALALGAVVALVGAAYAAGPVAIGWVLIATYGLGVVAMLAAGERSAPVRDLSATLLVVTAVGLPGAFAGLLLSPSDFPHRHGVALCFSVVAAVVAHDVGSYAAGSRLGRHKLAPRVSPGKTWEGWIGGSALCAVVTLGGLSHLHPLTLPLAAALTAVVAVVAPVGDLAESLIKRDLGLKDMGRLLPEHGGVFDRVDAMLLVLPAAYALFTAAHLG